MLKRTPFFIVLVLLVSACSKPASEATPTSTAATPETGVPFPTLPAQTPTPSLSPTPFVPFTVKPAVDNLKVRMNPGYLFDAWGMVQQTDELTVRGKAPGGEWINVETAAGTQGWVFRELLTSTVNLEQIPVVTPTEVVVLTGRVLDVNGTPIRGVGLDVKQGSEAEALSNPVVTDGNGEFFAFLPAEASGVWTVSYSAIGCPSNAWSDSTCSSYKTGYTGNLEPQTISVTLPQATSLALTWK